MQEPNESRKGCYPIFRASRRNPHTGQTEYARDFGKKCFVIWIKASA